MSPRTLTLGIAELEDESASKERIRQVGGGRKSAFETIAGLDEAFLRVLERHTAGSPTAAKSSGRISRHEIAVLFKRIDVSVTVVDQLLEKHNFRKRKAVKTLATGKSEHRNEQFETIERSSNPSSSRQLSRMEHTFRDSLYGTEIR